MVSVIDWIIGSGFMFGLAFVFTWITIKDIKVFFAFLTIFNAFMVWSGILELWTLILNVIILSMITYYYLYTRRGSTT